jgi:hypothetical protein
LEANPDVIDGSKVMSLARILVDDEPSGRRWRMKQLDLCLNELEEANADGNEIVSGVIAARWRQSVPQLTAGIPIVQGLDIIFRLQRDEMASTRGSGSIQEQEPRPIVRRTTGGVSPLSESGESNGAELDFDEASQLTEQIKSSLGHSSHLLLAAHEGRAWRALGHKTWESYVVRELGLSRRRSYELLDQARVARSIAAIAGLGGIPHISAYAAEQLKPVLDEVLETIRQRLHGADSSLDSRRVVEEVVRTARQSIASVQRNKVAYLAARSHRDLTLAASADDDSWSTKLFAALDTLCAMPAPATVARSLPADTGLRTSAEQAACWLQNLVAMWPS